MGQDGGLRSGLLVAKWLLAQVFLPKACGPSLVESAYPLPPQSTRQRALRRMMVPQSSQAVNLLCSEVQADYVMAWVDLGASVQVARRYLNRCA